VHPKYYLFVLLFLLFACSNTTTSTSEGGGGKPSVSSLKPVDIILPEADFTDVSSITQDKHSKVILNRLADLIHATPQGASIYMSIYLFGEEPALIAALRSAAARGVKLHIMMDSSHRSNKYNIPTVANLKIIAKDTDQNIEIVGIHNDISSNAINHNKFALFSEVTTKSGNIKNVVFNGSQNWYPNSEKENQNVVILSNKGLYQAFLHDWQIMKKHADQDMIHYTYSTYSDSEAGIYALFYPKIKNGAYFGPDPIVKILKGVTNPASTTIRIVMAFWTNGRVSIVNKLSELMDQGAKVEVITRSSVSDKIYDGLVALADKGAFVKMYNYSGDPNVKKVETHSKVMLIDGEWKGEKTNLIITGSHNYDVNALKHNNENNILLSSHNFKHPALFKHYKEHFNKLKAIPGVCCMKSNLH
jgi:phosphatidylserine/phosphatidylglycerophosphate/cardiolipin synthase-like enzyme